MVKLVLQETRTYEKILVVMDAGLHYYWSGISNQPRAQD
jgi:hypothetical protein